VAKSRNPADLPVRDCNRSSPSDNAWHLFAHAWCLTVSYGM